MVFISDRLKCIIFFLIHDSEPENEAFPFKNFPTNVRHFIQHIKM